MSERAVDGAPLVEVPGLVTSSAPDSAAGEQKRPWSHRWSGRGRWRTVIAWGLVAGWAAWALVRLTGADRLAVLAMPVVPLLSFTPYIAATAPVPVLGAVLLRRRRAAVVAALVAVALAVAVLPRAVLSAGPDATGPRLRVLTTNLMYGTADLERIVSLVQRTNADVLSVQELPDETVARLDAAGLTRLLPYRHLDIRPGALGSGLYSRHPLRAIPTLVQTRMAMPRAELTLAGGRRVEVSVVHPLPPIERNAYLKWRHDLRSLPAATASTAGPVGPAAAAETAATVRPPVRVLAGDFNATLDHVELRRILGRGYADAADRKGIGLVPTWDRLGRPGPPLTIDHVLADARCAVVHAEVFDLPGSDHRALLADLRLP